MKFFLLIIVEMLINVEIPTTCCWLIIVEMLINVEIPTTVGISTLMSMKNSILGLSEAEKCLIS